MMGFLHILHSVCVCVCLCEVLHVFDSCFYKAIIEIPCGRLEVHRFLTFR